MSGPQKHTRQRQTRPAGGGETSGESSGRIEVRVDVERGTIAYAAMVLTGSVRRGREAVRDPGTPDLPLGVHEFVLEVPRDQLEQATGFSWGARPEAPDASGRFSFLQCAGRLTPSFQVLMTRRMIVGAAATRGVALRAQRTGCTSAANLRDSANALNPAQA